MHILPALIGSSQDYKEGGGGKGKEGMWLLARGLWVGLEKLRGKQGINDLNTLHSCMKLAISK